MRVFEDIKKRDIRLTDERYEHLVGDHPEIEGQMERVHEVLLHPEKIIRSNTDPSVELFYRKYPSTPVSQKYLCIVVKALLDDAFIITAYFTDTIKKGEILWTKK